MSAFSREDAERVHNQNRDQNLQAPVNSSSSDRQQPASDPPQWSQDQKAVIDEVRTYIDSLEQWHHQKVRSERNRRGNKPVMPDPLHLVIFGGPGFPI